MEQPLQFFFIQKALSLGTFSTGNRKEFYLVSFLLRQLEEKQTKPMI